MATFDPAVQPVNQPADIYHRWTRPVEAPDNIKPTGVETNKILPEGVKIGDRSAEYQGEAAAAATKESGMGYTQFGDIFSGLAQGADFLTKAGDAMTRQYIDNKVYDQANAERERYTAELQAIRNTPGKGIGSILDANAAMTGDDGQPTPQDIVNLPDQLETLTSAKDGGKLSTTDYRGRLLQLAKDLRTQFPGYKQYIDDQFTKVTGSNPANAVITGLITDINRLNSSTTAEQNKLMGYVQSVLGEIDPDRLPEVLNKIRTGQIDRVGVMSIVAPYEIMKARLALQASLASNEQNSLTTYKQGVASYAQTRFNGTASTFLDGLKVQVAPGSEPIPFMDYVQRAQGGKNGLGEFNDEQNTNVIAQLTAARIRLQANLNRDMNAPVFKNPVMRDPNGRPVVESIAQAMGPDGSALKLAKENLDLFDSIIAGLKDPTTGAAFLNASTMKARSSDTERMIRDQPGIGSDIEISTALSRVYKDNPEALKQITTNLINNGVPQDTAEFAKRYTQQMLAQTGGKTTLRDVMSLIHLNKDAVPNLENPKVITGLIKNVTDVITNPKLNDDAKLNAVFAAFSNRNLKFIEGLNDDQVTPDGKVIPGKYSTFRDMGSYSVSRAMVELSKHSPKGAEGLASYKSWMEGTFYNDLYRRTLDDITKMAEDRKDISFNWNTNTNHLEAQTTTKAEDFSTSNPNNQVPRKLQEKLYFLNMGLDTMSNMYKAMGKGSGDVGEFILQRMQQRGFQPFNETSKGVPENIMKEILDAKQRAETNKKAIEERTIQFGNELSGKSNFAPEGSAAPANGLPAEVTQGKSNTKKKPVFNYSNEQILGIETRDIPENLSAREFLNQIKKANGR